MRCLTLESTTWPGLARLVTTGTLAVWLAGCTAPLFQGGGANLSSNGSGGNHGFRVGSSRGGPLASVPSSMDEGEPSLYHQVRAGESLENIAAIYHVPVPSVLELNGLDNAKGIKPGQLLYIPRSR